MSEDTLRLDKWLWYARFLKSRSLATRLCARGKVRVNANTSIKPHHALKPGDVLTFFLAGHVRVIEVKALATRRGPAADARTLYEDLEPPPPRSKGNDRAPAPPGRRAAGAGRPTKAERRATERLKGRR